MGYESQGSAARSTSPAVPAGMVATLVDIGQLVMNVLEANTQAIMHEKY
jgi:hypothetical protein